MAKLHIHPAGLVLVFLGIISWIVAVAGLGASTKTCYTNRPEGTTAGYCATLFQVEWWSVWFEFFLLVVMLGTVFVNAFERARFIYLTYLSMVTVLLTIAARNFINSSFASGGIDLKNYAQDAFNAAAAGCIMLCITNFALIIVVGVSAADAMTASSNGGGGVGGGSNFDPQGGKYVPSNF